MLGHIRNMLEMKGLCQGSKWTRVEVWTPSLATVCDLLLLLSSLSRSGNSFFAG